MHNLRVYRFEPGAVFEGGLVGAVERMQLDQARELLDALFVSRDARAATSRPWTWLSEAPAVRSRRCSTSGSMPEGAARSPSAHSRSIGAACRGR